jgi:hypothetical protein
LITLKDALAAAKASRDECIGKQWKIQRQDGRTIVLRDVFDRIVTWVEKLKDIGDLVAKLLPTYVELPWAVVSLFLQVPSAIGWTSLYHITDSVWMSVSDAQRFASVLEGIEQITNLLSRYALIEAIYLRQSSRAVDLLDQAVIKLYAHILTYLAQAKRYYLQNTASKNCKASSYP